MEKNKTKEIKAGKNIAKIIAFPIVAVMIFSAIPYMQNTANAAVIPGTIDPKTIPKFIDQLIIPPVYQPTNIYDENNNLIRQEYVVDVTEFYEQILPTVNGQGQTTGYGQTKVWGYGGNVYVNPITGSPGYFRYSPGATFEVTRGIPTQVKWVNNLVDAQGNPILHQFAVDPTLHWADPNNMGKPTPPFPTFPPGFPLAQSPVPIITHVHGAEVQSTSDGNPDAWYTADGIHGMEYHTELPTDANAAIFTYPNTQLPATIWYHDHAMGITRINVMSGLAGFYIIRDPADTVAPQLPQGQYEIPLAIQDRIFNLDGTFWYDTVGINPDIHPYWMPEFFGNTIMVNGHTWPNLNVEPRQYRFRILDGSNARFYTFSFFDKITGNYLPFSQIGGDGSYFPNPVTLNELTIAPGERADIIIDFSGVTPGTKILMKNTAKAPFPGGAAVDPQTTGQIMQFTVTGTPVTPKALPTNMITLPVLTPDAPSKTLTLFEVMGPAGPQMVTLDGQMYDNPVSELPQVGSTVDWIIVNPTADAHPIHTHLVQFQLVSRQKFQVTQYVKDWIAANGGMMPPFMNPTVSIPLAPYLYGKVIGPKPNELGWEDTMIVNPGEVTVLRIRFAPQDAPTSGPGAASPGVNLFAFDPTVGPGYVWHCHILEHEDNEMMRPYLVVN